MVKARGRNRESNPFPSTRTERLATSKDFLKPVVETAASGQALVVNPTEDGAGALAQGALEAANVNVVEEMVNMIETQRAYEINSKAISSVDSMLRFLNQNL